MFVCVCATVHCKTAYVESLGWEDGDEEDLVSRFANIYVIKFLNTKAEDFRDCLIHYSVENFSQFTNI